MKNLYIMIVLLIASVGFINQINAQTSNSILTEKSNKLIESQNENNSMYGINVFGAFNTPTVQKLKLKSAQTDLELLDSIVHVEIYDGIIYNGNKYEWEYDAEGNIISESNYYWNSDIKNWNGRQKKDSTFNADGNLSMVIINTWDTETRQWIINEKNELTYDAEGNLILYAIFYWNNETNEWGLNRKQEKTHTYTTANEHIVASVNYVLDATTSEWTQNYKNETKYDANGNMTFYNATFWDSTANDWTLTNRSFKYECAYNETGKQTLASYYNWSIELNQWVGSVWSNLTESTYDENGNATVIVIKNWDDTLNKWENSTKTESSYNANGLIIQQISYNLDSSSEDWLAVNQTKNTYSENGVLSNEIECEWDNEEKIWLDILEQEYIYNDQGNLFQVKSLQTDTISGEWSINAKDEYKYDTNNNEVLNETSTLNTNDQWIINNIKQTVYDAYGNIVLITIYASSDEGDNLVKDEESEFTYNESGDKLLEEATSYFYDGIPYTYKTNYYYSKYSVTSAIDIKEEAPGIYPNPFFDQLSFSLNDNSKQFDFELFDAQGRKVMSKSILNAEPINTSHLDCGIYIYKIAFDGNIQTGKLIKK